MQSRFRYSSLVETYLPGRARRLYRLQSFPHRARFRFRLFRVVRGGERASYYRYDRNLSSRKRMTEPTYEELKARLSQLEKEVETKKRSGDLIFKVGEKGGVSVYGLGRFPVTLYYEQWNRLLGAAEDLKQFMEENKARLKLKE